MLPVRIAGIGHYLPGRRVTSAELEERLGIPSGWIERATGVRERRYSSGETSVDMAVASCRDALDSSGVLLEDVDAIVGASTAPHQSIPCTAALVGRALGAPDGRSACWDVNATCLSFLFALQSVAHMVSAGVYRNVLLFSSELTSLSLNPKERESAVLFGDAAAAVLITRSAPGESSSIWHSHFVTYTSGAEYTQILGGGTGQHPNHPSTTPEMNFFSMKGPSIFKMGARLLTPFLDDFFRSIELDRSRFDAVVPHQASRHAIEMLTKNGFTHDQLVMNLPIRGNCIAASIPLALAEAVESGRIHRGNNIILVGSGAGFTLGATALTY